MGQRWAAADASSSARAGMGQLLQSPPAQDRQACMHAPPPEEAPHARLSLQPGSG